MLARRRRRCARRTDADLLLITQALHEKSPLYDILCDAAAAVHEGLPLSKAFAAHPTIFNPLVLALIKAGEASGTLKKALDYYAHYQETQQQFQRKLRMILMMPVITFIFFMGIVFALLIIVIPRFQAIFAMVNKPIPWATQVLFTMSSVLQQYGFWLGWAIVSGVLIIVIGSVVPHCKKWRDWLMIHTPGVKKIITFYSITFFLQALALLLEGGVHLVDALRLAAHTINNRVVRHDVEHIAERVRQGLSLSLACKQSTYFNLPELESFVTVGETSGILSLMIGQAAYWYQERLYQLFKQVTSVIQPALIIFLGALICLLILAIYVPILTFSTMLS